jgi:hypothetical protein
MLASTVVVAAMQRALGSDGSPLWLAKGGVYIQLRLGQGARATQDVDTLFRGAVDQFERALGDVLAEPWGPFALQVSDLEIIEGARRIAKPRRFEVRLMVKGAVWRKVRVEASFPEGRISERVELAPVPPVGFFGVAAPASLVGIALDYQVAQKLHASSDPDVEGFVNDRVRDVVDLVWLRERFYPGSPPASLRAACVDLFAARAAEAARLGDRVRDWPPVLATNSRWRELYPALAASSGFGMALDDAVAAVNAWVVAIDAAGAPDLGGPTPGAGGEGIWI